MQKKKTFLKQGNFFFPGLLSPVSLDHIKLAMLASFSLFFALGHNLETVQRLKLTLHSIILYVRWILHHRNYTKTLIEITCRYKNASNNKIPLTPHNVTLQILKLSF